MGATLSFDFRRCHDCAQFQQCIRKPTGTGQNCTSKITPVQLDVASGQHRAHAVTEKEQRNVRVFCLDDFSQRTHIRDDLVESCLIRKTDRFADIPVRFAMAAMIVSVDDDSCFRQLASKSFIASDMFGVTMRNLHGSSRFLAIFRRPFNGINICSVA
ncbi:hypothetical protein SDC9_123181 [bioreactor metagenome]|uniref:Uncharacterized protein n=1 Tax=bioreactor metagenome TaxID=1076179 RepID=A0A645CGX3_9ZZZZ